MSAFSLAAATHLPPSVQWQVVVCVFLEQFAPFVGARMGNKDAVLQTSGVCVLTAASDHRGTDTEVVVFATFVAKPSPSG